MIFFGEGSAALVRVGAESATLMGTASFQGTGVPEPAVEMLLILGAAVVVVLAKGVGGGASRCSNRSRSPSSGPDS